MRGLFSAGVIDVMMERGIIFDGIIGVSAGSNFGCNYKSMQPGRVIRYNTRFAKDPRYMGIRELMRSGNYIGAEFAYHTVPLELDVFDVETFEANPTEFYLVCTDVHTAEPVYYRMDRFDHESLERLRASASMPVITKPVKAGGRELLDGGISDSIPLKYFRSIGYGRNVVVLTQPLGYRKKPAPAWLFRMLLRKYPAIAEAMVRRHEMYNAQLDYIESKVSEGDTYLIAPEKPLPIGRLCTDIPKMESIYRLGREHCAGLIDDLRAFLDKSEARQ